MGSEEIKKVSIIIIIYKVERFLEQCIRSVMDQTYSNIEIICVVGKGDAACEEICDRLAAEDDRIVVIKEEPKGTAAARNTGLDNVHGDYIGFVDGDDYIEPDMIEVMVEAALKNDAEISVVGKYLAYENLVDGETVNKEYILNTEQAYEMVLYQDGFFLHIWDKLYKKEIFDGVRFPVGKLVEDRQLATRLIGKANKIVYNSASKYYFRVSEDSGSRIEENLRLSLKADYEICEEILKSYAGLKKAVDFFLIDENMSVLQNSMIFGTYSREHDKEYREYIIKNEKNIRLDSHFSRGMHAKILMCKYCPSVLNYLTVYRRKKFLNTHISFSTGANWEKTFRKQGM